MATDTITITVDAQELARLHSPLHHPAKGPWGLREVRNDTHLEVFALDRWARWCGCGNTRRQFGKRVREALVLLEKALDEYDRGYFVGAAIRTAIEKIKKGGNWK